ncbi:MAG: alpha-L-fucosidase [Candidatus Symbiothrix sp.]|jgi:alpha-L-fucosidase|nr:alpha-L-fucosidase [Candidatus Symbiothrix sp.]
MKKIFCFILCLCTLICTAQRREEDDNRAGFNLNKPEREEWLRDLGFGLFIHWAHDSQLGIVISHSLAGASDDYCQRYFNELPKTFNPDKFDARKWAQLAKITGVKYVVFTTKHHSGFCMWYTQTSDFGIMNTPYGKDILKELVSALREEGLAVGFYYSPEDFKFLYDNGIAINRGDMKFSDDFIAKYNDFIEAQCTELFTRYGKVDILFIDGEPKDPAKYTGWKLQPDLLVTRGAVNTPEQTVPGTASDVLWESNITMGNQWQYKPTNDELKSGTRLIEILIETRAKGGNFLLNIGPHPDGYIPKEQEERMREMAAWMFINRESIYAVRPWILTNEDNLWFSRSKDGKSVYVYITGMPDWTRGSRKEFVLHSVKATAATKASVLGQNDLVLEYSNQIPDTRFEQTAEGLKVSCVRAQRIYNNNKWPNPIVLKLENVEPALNPPQIETKSAKVVSGKVVMSGKLASTGNNRQLKVGFLFRPYAGFVENLNSREWQKSPLKEIATAGEFSIEIPDLSKNTTYEFKAIVVHPLITISGETKTVRSE